MGGFPKGLQCLVVDDAGCQGPAAIALSNREFGYCVTTVTSLAAAQACFAGGTAAFDVAVCEYALLQGAPPGTAAGFFRAADAVHTPVVLMGEGPSQTAVLQAVRWGAVDFIEKPLSMLKLRTLWQHKIRKMIERGNGGVLPRRPSCPHLAAASAVPAAVGSEGTPPAPPAPSAMPRISSLPGMSCPATPSLRTASLAAQPSSSLGSGDSGCQQQQQPGASGTGLGNCSDATSGVPRIAQPTAEADPAQHHHCSTATPEGPAAPLACVRLGAPGEALPAAVVHWPALPAGTTWGTPVGCGVPPPALPGSGADAAASGPPPASAFRQPSIKWISPGSLPMPASTYDLLLPENWSLAGVAAGAGDGGIAGARGPLGLRLTVTPDLLDTLNSTLQAPHRRPHLDPATA